MDREITLDDLSGMLDGDYSHVYMHVTAGHYGQHSSNYHLNIDSDGSIYLTKPLTETPAATWHRNTGSIAVTLDCEPDAQLFGDGTTDFGSEPPTSEQIECLAQVLAVISNATGLPIDAEHMMTHAEAAELDGYGPNTTCERWDLWTLPDSRDWGSGGDYIRGKALWYQNEWENE